MPKREGYISWPEYFMGVAKLSAMRSKDPNTQVGACIVANDKRILSLGYNGFPIGASDDNFPWEKKGDLKDTKYAYVVHAELNAILNTHADLRGTTLYVTLFPCNECAKAIVQAGFRTVYYENIKHPTRDDVVASKRILDAGGVKQIKYTPSNKRISFEI